MAGGVFPEDMVREILSLLPVKSLLRFRCVCKLWCSLIENPSFTALHHSRASLRKNDYLVVNRFSPYYHKNFMSIHSEIEAPADFSTYFDVPLFEGGLSFIKLLGPSNGLICLTDLNNHIVLCNPATRQFKALPVPQFPYPDDLSVDVDGVGFGFDPKTSDYKVVRLVKLFKRWPMAGVDSYKTQVYSLSSNSWRQIEIGAGVSRYHCSATLNGAFHWFSKYGDLEETMVAFRMSDEVFQRIPLPDICCSPPNGYRNSLSVLNESLALIRYGDCSWYGCMDKHFDIWVMNEYGVKESWTRYCKFGPILGIGRPLVFWKNSELLLETTQGKLVSCNLYDQNVKHFQVDGVSNTLGVVMYSESLVLI